MLHVYVLRSVKDGKRYIGLTADVTKRLAEHNSGRVFSTKGRRPFVVIHVESYSTIAEGERTLLQISGWPSSS